MGVVAVADLVSGSGEDRPLPQLKKRENIFGSAAVTNW